MAANKIPKANKLVPLLLSWFAANARDLPWRRTRDPYAIWVSEIMLQQTQVKTVIPYWERWMRALPTIESVAKAKSAKLHKLWEGLGYYTRVRNLQKAARQIVADDVRRRNGSLPSHSPPRYLGGYTTSAEFPEYFDAILALPGIGRYTAGAICSIAFNQPKPILDGNVIRVLTRVFGITTDPRKKNTNARLWQIAEELVTHAHERWGDRPREPDAPRAIITARGESRPTRACSQLNQSLMEMGALICTPRAPQCGACALTKLCVARRRGWQEKLPKPSKEPATTARRFIAFVVERNGKFLVRQRPDGVVNGQLWEFPNVEVGAQLSEPQRTAAKELRLRPTSAKPLCTIKHSITRYRITLEAWRAELAKPSNKIPGLWQSPAQLRKLAFTSAHKKVLNCLRQSR